jgi:hypothetical protein
VEMAAWHERLGDARTWDGRRCARALREEWHDGGVEALCQRGVEACFGRTGTSGCPNASQHSAPASAKAKPKRPAQVSLTQTAAPQVAKRLSEVKHALRNLEQVWASTSMEACASWHGLRWTVVLEEVEAVLLAVLSGLHPQHDLTKEVRAMGQEWKGQLQELGVSID